MSLGNPPELDAVIEEVENLRQRVKAIEDRKLVSVITLAENEKPGMPPMIIFNETLVNAEKTPYGQNIPGRLCWQKPDGTLELVRVLRVSDPIVFRDGKPT